jgi:hypothetical protein
LQRGRLDRRQYFRIDRLRRRQDRHPGFRETDSMREIDRVLHDVDLILQRRRDVHRRIGDDQRSK